MSVKVVFVIIGIVFWLIRNWNKQKEQNSTAPKKARQAKASSSQSGKSIDDIFNDFVKEVENSKKQTQQKAYVKPAPVVVAKKKSEALDWQQVDKTKIKPKEMLIDHEDYHYISHRVDKEHQIENIMNIAETEGEVFEFDVDNIDWRQAIITKEVLDTKYI